MNILPKKSWHVRNKDNVARVRRDEERAAAEEKEVRRRGERAEQEARTAYLRRKSRAALELTSGHEGETARETTCETVRETTCETVRETGETEHLNLFPLEDSSEKKGNAEYLREKKEEKEKQERAIGLLVSLGPAPGTEATPWYLKERWRDKGAEKESEREKEGERRDKGKGKGISEEEKEKKDRKLKDRLDPLKDIRKALAVKDRKEKKHKKKEKTSVGSSKERLRAERLQREAEERRRAQALLDKSRGVGGATEGQTEPAERDRPYNSAYFPELARKRQRRDKDIADF
ncbi:leukocyte receptor cluster member 1, partial [Silurus asotus]